MICRLEVLLRKVRRRVSRSEWLIRLFRLPKSKETATTPGLVMIQIDGLSHTQLNRALENDRMPSLRNLLGRERYCLHTLYSGMPSSTPAVQGELFYGVKCATPAFSYMDRESGQVMQMFDPASAAGVEHKLEKKGEALLKGGSAYTDIYTGGAAEAHFCPSSLGWGSLLRVANPLALSFFILSNAYSFVRTAVLLVIEFFLAIVDCLRGLINGHDLVKELKFVPTRVAICILLRELVTIGTKIDMARGLPVLHLNFIGYDEQAHRRGPSSKFAHWTLKGIDDAIARIWRAAKRSARRDYDVWVYSDHGQEKTLPYPNQHGRTIEEAVADVFEHLEDERTDVRPDDRPGIQYQRARHLGGKKIQKLFPVHREAEEKPKSSKLAVTAMGPLGMVYASPELAPAERDRLARQLVDSAKVPLVLVTDGPVKLRAWTEEGEFVLPEQKEKILGPDHPFLEEVTRDLIALCQHPDAGDFVICGWRAGAEPYSFPIENGSHAGPGPEETKAFALLPADTPLPERHRDYLRPMDLRHAAFHALGRSEGRISMKPNRKTAADQTLRIMTYNVHSCIGMDGKILPERIARVIAQHAPDIVALQELDVGRSRTNGVDQACLIARSLEMEFHFHPSIRMEKGLYGNAILTHFPMRPVRADKLPGLPNKPHLEPRGALWAAIDVHGTEIQFITTHLGLRMNERRVQADALLNADWLSHPDCREPIILCGDFNALPSAPVCLRLRGRLHDAQIKIDNHRPKNTWFGRYPSARIDHVFVDVSVEVVHVEVPSTELTRVSSDHLPLIVDVRIPRERAI
ncbi:MAG: endonuclease/exonuclease/phosphatase family protein [Deltaproteobacteria bacterium]|nr:endonuclease/exonuclease/phosphatase family protein [Deltaproteobacteria bacterium]